MHKVLALALALAATPLAAHDFMSGAIHVSQPWTRQTAPTQTVAGAFMTIANHGKVDDRLIDGESPIADKVEIHSMTMDGNIMRMRPMPEGIAIPAHGSATLAPGGVHLMLTGLKRPIAGGMVPLTLRFAKAGKVSISLMVEPIGSSGGEDHHDHH